MIFQNGFKRSSFFTPKFTSRSTVKTMVEQTILGFFYPQPIIIYSMRVYLHPLSNRMNNNSCEIDFIFYLGEHKHFSIKALMKAFKSIVSCILLYFSNHNCATWRPFSYAPKFIRIVMNTWIAIHYKTNNVIRW